MSNIDLHARAAEALDTVVTRLLDLRSADGHWDGELSSSALSTATAISALCLAGTPADADAITLGLHWLARTINPDGGWGDTPDSPSNLSTTLLAVAAFAIAAGKDPAALSVPRPATDYIHRHAGQTPQSIVAAVVKIYGADRTFAVPILANCALGGLVPWDAVPPLPYPLAAVPHSLYRALRLQVVSYALPALIAIGLSIDHHRHRTGAVGRLATGPILRKLSRIQPESGGFLEATPLTSFVAMSLAPVLGPQHEVVTRCVQFLRRSRRADGSWPIDTNLATWLTTASVAALASAGQLHRIDREAMARWIASQQHRAIHPYTNAPPGAWAWTYLSGGVPDADDTAGAMIALCELGHSTPLRSASRWLANLQNSDGGWPTFCRGWGKLPFDRSAPDLTAHAVRALHRAAVATARGIHAPAIGRGIRYLQHTQRPEGSWIPLWFGNQHAPAHENPVLGTARVLRALEELNYRGPMAQRGADWLIRAAGAEGGWGGNTGVPATLEETALAISALCGWRARPEATQAIDRGVRWLIDRIEANAFDCPAPIGLYFASLWYSEHLYPLIWATEALGRFCRINACSPVEVAHT